MSKYFPSGKSLIFQILIANIISLGIYLVLVFNDGLLGYVAIPLFLLSYMFVFFVSLFLLITGIQEQSTSFIISALVSFCWIMYGIGSEFLSDGIDCKILISLLAFSIVINLYFYVTPIIKLS